LEEIALGYPLAAIPYGLGGWFAGVKGGEGRALPPVMGQWAEGDLDMLQEAIGCVIHAAPNAWKMVIERLRKEPSLGENDSEIIDRVAKSWATDPRRVLLDGAVELGNPNSTDFPRL
jgi:hypothetical protein